jgi:peroxiredoxin Q/BCP
MPRITEGRKAPDFTLEDGLGGPVSLADFKGQDVVVYFYPKDDTPGCTKEACGFRDLWKDLQRAGVVVLGISADSPASHASFSGKHRLPFTLLSDPDRKVMTAWGAYGEKVLYGKKTTGVIRSTVWVGPDWTVRKHWRGWPTPPSPRPGPRDRPPRGRLSGPPATPEVSANMRHAG